MKSSNANKPISSKTFASKTFDGSIAYRELDRETFEFSATQADAWVRRLLERSAPPEGILGESAESWAGKAQLSVSGNVEKTGSQYLLRAHVKGALQNPCSRCGDVFESLRETQCQVVITRVKRGSPNLDDDSGDADFLFLQGEELSLVDLLSEQLIAIEPVADCPTRQDDGSCSLCHKNPVYGSDAEPLASHMTPDRSTGQELGNKAFSALFKLKE